jgi:type I restriction enzyme, S subunit
LNWPKVKLSTVVEILDFMRKPVKASNRIKGPYPYYGANGQQGTINDYIFNEPLILVAEDGGHFFDPLRPIAYRIEGKTWVNNHAHVLRCNPDMDISYLCHQLARYNVEPYLTGSTRAKLTKGALERILITKPPLEEQKRIAVILDKADEIHNSVVLSIEVKPAIIRSIFLDMFGDMLTNSMDWPTSPLGEISDTQLGKAISKEAKLCLSPSKYLRNANVQWREIDFLDLKEMDFKESEKSKLRIHDGDILATEGGDVGRCAIWDYGQQEIYFQNSLHRIRVDETLLTPEYLVEYFAIMSERGGLIRETTQVTIAHLTGAKLRKLIVPLPPLSMQKRFTRILEGINSFHTSAKQRTNEIVLSLQQEMFA